MIFSSQFLYRQIRLQGQRHLLTLLTVAGLSIPIFVSDRHRDIAKWLRECHPNVQHFFDQWHIAKSVVKKMIAASKEKGCEKIAKWTTGLKPHLLVFNINFKGFSHPYSGQMEVIYEAHFK